MKNTNRILVVLLIISLFGAILTFRYLVEGLFPNGQLGLDFTLLAYFGAGFFVSTIALFIVFYLKFLKMQNFGNYIFFITLPITVVFAFGFYFLLLVSASPANQNLEVIQLALGVNSVDNANWYLWFLVLALGYILITFMVFSLLTRPVRQVQKATNRLSDGIVKDRIMIKGSKQFKDIEFSLNKINDNYKKDARVLKETHAEVEKFIPKQFLRFFGVNNILDLELGNSVQKEVTTLFCDIKNSLSISSSLSLEENFNFINAYLNVISPLIRRYNGFVDKYLGDGIMAVFQKPEHAFECSKAIFSVMEDGNFKTKNLPPMKVEISLHTGEVVFGVVGEENRKSLTVLADGVSLASKLGEVNKFLGTKVVFSKRTLNSLPYGFHLNYRYVGSLKQVNHSNEAFNVFESLDVYPRVKREKLINLKRIFENGVRLYDDGDFHNARAVFEGILKKFASDSVAFVYFNMCEEKLKLERS